MTHRRNLGSMVRAGRGRTERNGEDHVEKADARWQLRLPVSTQTAWLPPWQCVMSGPEVDMKAQVNALLEGRCRPNDPENSQRCMIHDQIGLSMDHCNGYASTVE